MREDHDCVNLTRRVSRPTSILQQQREKGLAALQKLKLISLTKNTQSATPNSNSRTGPKFGFQSREKREAAAEAAKISELKRMAKGNEKIPPGDRIYLYVKNSQNENKTWHLFFEKSQTVGRFLDAAAKAMQIQNLNNRGVEEEKLRVEHEKSGHIEDLSATLESVAGNGHTLTLVRGTKS